MKTHFDFAAVASIRRRFLTDNVITRAVAPYLPLVPADLSSEQKAKKVKNLLNEMRSKDESIASVGRGPGAVWRLTK